MPFRIRLYEFLTAFLVLPALIPGAAMAAISANYDSLRAPFSVHTVEGLPINVVGSGVRSDLFPDRLLLLTQTNNAPFLSGLDSSGPALAPAISLAGTTDYTQAGVYTIDWTLQNDSIPTGTLNVTTTLTVHDLVPPTGVHAYYVAAPGNVPISNGTGVLSFVVWDGSGVQSDPISWNGFRVRRTIHGARDRKSVV